MSVEVYMPKMGMTMQEGTIVKWLKKEGDVVKKEEPIAEISSEKITNEIEAPEDGLLEKIIVQEGEIIEVGAVIAHIAKGFKEPKDEIKVNDTITKQEEYLDYETMPLNNVRKVIGQRMTQSLRDLPQGTMTTRADMSELIAFKDKLATEGYKITYTDLFIKIVSIALQLHPILNSTIKDGNVITYKKINIGVVVGTDDATFVPVIKNVEQKNILHISKELKELALKIKENRINSEDMMGGTFTVSNLGMFDVDVITPILNPPESGILAIGSTRQEVVVEEGKMVIKPLTTLCITTDHTLVDGVPAVKFLSSVKKIMKNPKEYLSI